MPSGGLLALDLQCLHEAFSCRHSCVQCPNLGLSFGWGPCSHVRWSYRWSVHGDRVRHTQAVIATMTFSLAERVPSAVPIIPLSGITLPGFASRPAAEWFHISTEKLCYQSQLLSSS
jgi:hypothetical protein